MDSKRGVGNALRILSDVQRECGAVSEALETARQAVDIALGLRHRVTEGFWLLSLGDAQRESGEHAEALESYHRSATIHRRVGDRSREALAWQGAGETYRAMGRVDEATAFHRRAAATFHELADPWHESLALAALADALHDTDPAEARTHRTEALRLLTDYDDPRAVAERERLNESLTGPS